MGMQVSPWYSGGDDDGWWDSSDNDDRGGRNDVAAEESVRATVGWCSTVTFGWQNDSGDMVGLGRR